MFTENTVIKILHENKTFDGQDLEKESTELVLDEIQYLLNSE